MKPLKSWGAIVLLIGLAALASCSDRDGDVGQGEGSAATGRDADSRTSEDSGADVNTGDGSGTTLVADVPIEPWRRELLEIAFSSASKFPLVPHDKNRARAQEAAAIASLELDQPILAMKFYSGIENWRRGAGYADLAYYKVGRGDTSDARELLDEAARISMEVGGKEGQEWRRALIRAKVARVYHLLGDSESAAGYEVGVEAAQSAPLGDASARMLKEEDFAEQLEALDVIFAGGNFDQIVPSMRTAVELYRRFFDDVEKRTALRERVSSAYEKFPLAERLGNLSALAETALENGANDEAAGVTGRMAEILAAGRWRPENEVKELARIAGLRFRAGRREEAAKDIARAIARYDDSRDAIESIWRAGALRPIAEAFHAMGDREAALNYYRRAVEEGMVNPNSRPRCDDLVATSCSMALHAFEPDEKLWKRIREISEGLGEPW